MSRNTNNPTPRDFKDGIAKLKSSQGQYDFYAHWCSVTAMQRAIVDGNFDSFAQVWRTLNTNTRRNQLVLWADDMAGIAHFKVSKGELDSVRKSTRDGTDEIIAGLQHRNEEGEPILDDEGNVQVCPKFMEKLNTEDNHVFRYKQPKATGTKQFYAEEVKNRIASTIKRFRNEDKYEATRPEDAEFLTQLYEGINKLLGELPCPATPDSK